MPVSSLYGSAGGLSSSSSGSGVLVPSGEVIAELLPESPSSHSENRAVKLALELALLQGGGGASATPASNNSSSSSSSTNNNNTTNTNGSAHHHPHPHPHHPHHHLHHSLSNGNSSGSSSSSSSSSNSTALGNGAHSNGNGHHGGSSSSLSDINLCGSNNPGGASLLSSGGNNASTNSNNPLHPPPMHLLGSTCALVGGSLEDLKMRRSQNMTECVPVPSSEHVAEIVGRQGCKIKALRAKTNTYIKTPVRGDEPVFVVTGRKEDVALAKREILSAAEHFSQIRASRKNQINSTLAFGQMVANSPGQTTTQVRVPYRVVGLVVGPKGATIKRIQQTTHTYIVTPSRDKEPVFEVTGLPENVDAARKEIEAHIAIRTGSGFLGGELLSNEGSNNFDLGSSSGMPDNNFNGYEGGTASVSATYPAGRSVSPHNSSSILNNDHFTASLTNKTLQHLLDEQHQSNGINIHSSAGGLLHRGLPGATSVWSNGTDSHDSGIGHSPPFDSLGSSNGGGILLGNPGIHGMAPNNPLNAAPPNGVVVDKIAGIWGELNKVLGNLDINGGATSGLESGGGSHSGKQQQQQAFINVGSRSSVDLGTLGSLGGPNFPINSPSSCSSAASSSGHRPSLDLGQPSVSFTAMTNSTSSPPEDADQSNNEDFVDEPSVYTN